jgi:hypothetical protein
MVGLGALEERDRLMNCEEALRCWQHDVLGLPVDPEHLEHALEHIRSCSLRCAQVLGTVPFPAAGQPPRPAGSVEFYEALGLEAEEQGDAHAQEWARLSASAASREADTQRERELALACWLAAETAYQQGWQVEHTAFLRAGLARLQQKRLPALPAQAEAQPPAQHPANSFPQAALQQQKPRPRKRLPADSPLLPAEGANPLPPAPDQEPQTRHPRRSNKTPDAKPGARRGR